MPLSFIRKVRRTFGSICSEWESSPNCLFNSGLKARIRSVLQIRLGCLLRVGNSSF